MDKEPFARLEGAALEHVVPDGEHRFGQRRRLDESQPLRDRQAHCFGDRAKLGIATATDERADEIAYHEARCPRTERHDLARDLHPKNIGRAFGRRVEALTLEHVGTVDAGSLDLDQDLPRAGRRQRPHRRHEHLGAASTLRLDDRHGRWQHHIFLDRGDTVTLGQRR